MRTIHKYNKEFESFLITLDEDQFLVWLESNEILYDTTFEELIKQDQQKSSEVIYV